ncbi:ABC efflux pump, inner membrane subunit [Candidatus Koribacter versatilis Ellin345]|uniref:ABC efflux pump, inner membrane subunit n=1 Tax=Koribacter versatilis (strain Ellin345) TaxID=204669 RepID=Q1IV06_KORVE|nr:ABC transporter permease [Candidatus Koribacter versatilis]ABF39294.1 ABC efflux pump, inner membrane subunit [Candidatus Koribacter versatilis Ellin345]
MNNLLQDIKFGVRTLLRSPSFTVVAVLTIALAIGANTAMFSVINAVLLRPLPYNQPDRVMAVWQYDANQQINAFTTPNFVEWKRQGGIVAQLSAFTSTAFNIADQDVPERVAGGNMQYELLPNFGVQPVLGRNFTPEEDSLNGPPVAILSNAMWRTRFNSDPNILNQTIKLDSVAYTIIGVMPANFYVLNRNELLWTPLKLNPTDPSKSRRIHWMWGFLRLPDGMTKKQGDAEVNAITARLKAQDPSGDASRGLQLQSMPEFVYGDVKPALLLLMGSVGLVLLIACANVINLLLARGAARRSELSVRSALGAPRARLIRQLLTESLVLSICAGALGLGLGALALKSLLAMHPTNIPRVEEVRIDGWVLGFTFLVSLLVGVIFGLAPAVTASRANVAEVLKDSMRTSSGRIGRQRSVFVFAETALACMLLIGAGLASKSIWKLQKVDPGFNPHNVSVLRVSAPRSLLPAQLPEFYRRIFERVSTLPGVEAAALGRDLPMSGAADPSMPITIDGNTPALAEGEVITRFRSITPNYFRTLQTPVLRGREFADTDTSTSQPVAIVSKSLADRYWPNEDPVGKRLKPEIPDAPYYTVVGEVADVRHWSLDIQVEPTAYYPYTQLPPSIVALFQKNMSIAVRGTAGGIVPSVRAAVGEIDKTVPVFNVHTMDELFSDSGSLRRFDMALLLSFAGLALVLSAIGVYGVIAYSVAQRTREIAIRMAVGAQRKDVFELVIAQGAKVAGVGVVAGVIGALLLAKVMSSLLYEVNPRDLLTFCTVPFILMVVILLACYIPAHRAASVEPNTALRYE